MATLALTNDELYSEIGRCLGISRDNGTWGTDTQADVDRIVRSGRRRFFSANNWKFLVTDTKFSILEPFTDGTVTVVAGVVTFAGSPTVPTDTVNYVFAPQGGGVYEVASYDSTTQITLSDTSVSADALSTYSLYKIIYDLPTGFGGWEGPFVVENYNGGQINESRNFPEYVLRAFANRETARTGRPELFSIVSTPDSETAIATHQVRIYPLPDQAYIVSGRYKIHAGDTLDAAESAISADPVFTECYKESILAACEIIAFGQPGSHSARFVELLREAVRQDNAMANIRYGRPRKNSRGRNRYYDL
jgi:hypothetical protein